jgi:hypothetical protein
VDRLNEQIDHHIQEVRRLKNLYEPPGEVESETMRVSEEEIANLPPGVDTSTPLKGGPTPLLTAKGLLDELKSDLAASNLQAMTEIQRGTHAMLTGMNNMRDEFENFKQDCSQRLEATVGGTKAPGAQGFPTTGGYVPLGQESMRTAKALVEKRWEDGTKKHVGSAKPYTGKEDWLLYLNYFNATADLNRWCEGEMCLELKKALQGDAARVLSEAEMENGSFKDMCTVVNERFNPAERETQYRNELMGLKKGPSESIDAFAAKWRELYNKSSPKDKLEVKGKTSPYILTQFIVAMNSARLEKKLMNKQFNTLSEICTVVRQHEVTETSLRSRWGKAADAVYPSDAPRASVKVAAMQATAAEVQPKKPKGAEGGASNQGDKQKNMEAQIASLMSLLQSTNKQLTEAQSRSYQRPYGGAKGTSPGRPYRGGPDPNETRICLRCGVLGHIAWWCSNTHHAVSGEALRPSNTMKRPGWVVPLPVVNNPPKGPVPPVVGQQQSQANGPSPSNGSQASN